MYALEDEMTDFIAWIIVGGSIGWVASLVVRADVQQHTAQYRRGRPLARSWYRAK